MDLPLPLITVQGTPRDCGVAYGVQAAEMILANTSTYLARFMAEASLEPEQVRRAGAAYRERTADLAHRIAAMLDGVAEGSGADVNELYALNARTELLYGRAPSECTAIGVLDTRTANGHTLLAQNWDWHPSARPNTLLLKTVDERGFAVLALTEAGMLAKAGINSAGIGVCVNML